MPDAILLRLSPDPAAWHAFARRVLTMQPERSALSRGWNPDPGTVPDILRMPLALPRATKSYPFFVEWNSDYWSVLWNRRRLGTLETVPPCSFGEAFGLTVGGIWAGPSAGQVARRSTMSNVCAPAHAERRHQRRRRRDGRMQPRAGGLVDQTLAEAKGTETVHDWFTEARRAGRSRGELAARRCDDRKSFRRHS